MIPAAPFRAAPARVTRMPIARINGRYEAHSQKVRFARTVFDWLAAN